MTKILLCGCTGKMGAAVRSFAAQRDDCEISAGIDLLGGELGFPVYTRISDVREAADVVVDFSHPSALSDILEYCQGHKGTAAVLCTTGYTPQQVDELTEAAKEIPIFYSRNMSLGINLLIELSKTASAILGQDFDVEIVEAHHNQKIDAPSGTALMLADAINHARGDSMKYTYDRHSQRKKRDGAELGIHSIRGGTIVGEHQVIFAGQHEVISLSHSAQSKELFASGAVNAAVFMAGRGAGLYDMGEMIKGGARLMADIYDHPEIYDERYTSAAEQAYRQHYEKMFAGKDIKTVLDCSFGTGNLTLPMAALGIELSGSDLSGPMLERAKTKAAEMGLSIPLVQCDFRELSEHFDHQFDCVMSTGSAFAHVSNEDIVRTLHEMDKLVKPGGYLYYDSRNWEQELKDRSRFKWMPPFIAPDGLRINCVQDWDFNPDGTISIHILHGYERDGRIFRSNDFEERLTPFTIGLVCSAIRGMGYDEPVIKPCPWFQDKPLEETGWYCLMARKQQ